MVPQGTNFPGGGARHHGSSRYYYYNASPNNQQQTINFTKIKLHAPEKSPVTIRIPTIGIILH
jgi:hypothetical protein